MHKKSSIILYIILGKKEHMLKLNLEFEKLAISDHK